MAKQYILCTDLGTRQDYTTIGILDLITEIRRDEKIDEMLFSRPSRSLVVKYGLVKLERLPLKLTYPAIIDKIANYFYSDQLYNKTSLVCDASGVGIPVVQMMRNQGLPPFGVTITSGDNIGCNDLGYTVPKKVLVSYLMRVIDSERLIISKGIEALEELLVEIQNFKKEFNRRTNNTTYENARDAIHDDLVSALLLGVFFGEHVLGGSRTLEEPDTPEEEGEGYDILRSGIWD